MNVRLIFSLFIIGILFLQGQEGPETINQEGGVQVSTPEEAEQMPPEPVEPSGQPTVADVVKEQVQDAAEKKEEQEREKKEKEAQAQTPEDRQAEEKRKKIFEEGEGISTLDLEGGNWLLKRQALEKTIDVLEKINKLFTAIIEQRLNFLAARNKADHDLDLFILELGIETGDLSRLLSSLQEDLEDERKKQGDLTEQEREALETVGKKLDEIKQLQAALTTIANLDDALDDVIMQVEKEISKSNAYQMQGWKNFQTIKKVLSDEKAEELYLQTDGLYKNLQDIQRYLSGELLSYFNATLSKINTNMTTIKNEFETLKNLGLDLKKEIDQYIHTSEEVEEKELVEQIAEEQKPPVKKSWIDSLTDFWSSIKEKMANMWNSIFSLFGTKTVPVAVQPVETAKPAEKPAEEKSVEK